MSLVNKKKRTEGEQCHDAFSQQPKDEKPIKKDAVFHRLLTTHLKDANCGWLQRAVRLLSAERWLSLLLL